MIIKNISIFPIQHKMINCLKTHSINHQNRDSWIISVTDSDGIIGYGEASPLMNFNEETFEESGYALEGFKLAVKDLNEDIDLKEIMILIDAHTLDTPSACFAIQTAIYDILSIKKELPLNQYLNSNSSKQIKLNGLHGITSSIDYDTVKVKCGFRNLYDEIEFLESLINKYGLDTDFIIDLNQAYDLPRAIRFLKEITKFNIKYVEQPIDKYNLEDLSELRLHSSIPIALDESVRNLDSIQNILDCNAADIFVLKPQSIGNYDKINDAVKLIRSANKKVTISSSLEGAIGRFASMHLAFANNINMHCGVIMESIYKNENIDLNIGNSTISSPNSNGLGFKL